MNACAGLRVPRNAIQTEKRCLELAKHIHPDLSQADEEFRRRYLELVKKWHPQEFWDELDRLGADARFQKEWQDHDSSIPSATFKATADLTSDCAPSSGAMVATGIIGLGASYFAAKHFGKHIRAFNMRETRTFGRTKSWVIFFTCDD